MRGQHMSAVATGMPLAAMPVMSEQRKDSPERIDIDKPAEVRRWAERFGVTEEEIRQAVKVVGPQIAAVRARLAANRSY